MVLPILTVLIAVALGLLHSEVDGKRKCSCYTFESGGSTKRMNWQQAKSFCESNNKYLVVMETMQEWGFINQAIRNRTAVPHNEWLIGLMKNRSSGQWTWINGKSLTIDKWQRDKPGKNDFYAVMAKEWPHGFYGSFDSIRGNAWREFICEEETDDCQGVCMHHNPAPTSTPPKLATSSSTADAQRACSCYTFQDGRPHGKTWTQARQSCEANNKHLVVMETMQEWEFINKTIKNQTAVRYDEWHIGLLKDEGTGKWAWINGKNLTINKWQNEKTGNYLYALIAKEYPPGSYGLFSRIQDIVPRGWICEEETDNCQGVCLRHNSAPTTTMPPRISTTHSTETIKSSSAKSTSITDGQAHSSDSTTPVTFPRKHAQQSNKDDSTVYIIAASLGTLLFLSLTALSVAVVFLLKYKKRRENDTRGNNAKSMNAVRGEAEELILNPADRGRQQRLSNEESQYADLDTHKMTTPNGVTYASLLKSEGGNNLEESPATDLFPRSGKGEEPLSPDYVNQIPTPTYENI